MQPPTTPAPSTLARQSAGLGALLACAAIVAVGAVPQRATAQGFRSMDNSPIAQFEVEDFKMMKAAIQQALETGQRAEWKNEQTGSSGAAVVASGGSRADCRMVAVENRHQKRFATSQFQFCKVEGAWRVVSDPR